MAAAAEGGGSVKPAVLTRELRNWKRRALEAEDHARYLHGLCLLYGIKPDEHRLKVKESA